MVKKAKLKRDGEDKVSLRKISANIIKHREKLGLTQEELAERVSLHSRSIQRIEAGADLRVLTLKKLVTALEVESSKDILGF